MFFRAYIGSSKKILHVSKIELPSTLEDICWEDRLQILIINIHSEDSLTKKSSTLVQQKLLSFYWIE